MTARGASLGTALLLALAACQANAPKAPPAAPQPAPIAAAPEEPLGKLACRDDVEGATVVVDRGIGGTGISGAPGSLQTADRGIGGTGVSDGTVDLTTVRGHKFAERGTGGTGIVGLITGFASVCLNGVEVGVSGTAAISEDGAPAQTATLRLGELAAIDASAGGDGLRAVTIAIRHEVSGPIDRIGRDGSGLVLQVAGQTVVANPDARVAADLAVGDWVAVSGLRDLQRSIRASRIDRRAPGMVTVSGRPAKVGGQWQVGQLPLRFDGPTPTAGERLIMQGNLAGGALHVSAMRRDPVVADAVTEHHLWVEGYAASDGKQLQLSQGLQADLGPNFGAPPAADQLAVVEFVSSGAAALTAVGWHPAKSAGGASAAPIHNLPVTLAPVAPVAATVAATVATTASTTAATSGGDASAGGTTGGTGGASGAGGSAGAGSASASADGGVASGAATSANANGRASASANGAGGDGPATGSTASKATTLASAGKTVSISHSSSSGGAGTGATSVNTPGSGAGSNGVGTTGSSGTTAGGAATHGSSPGQGNGTNGAGTGNGGHGAGAAGSN